MRTSAFVLTALAMGSYVVATPLRVRDLTVKRVEARQDFGGDAAWPFTGQPDESGNPDGGFGAESPFGDGGQTGQSGETPGQAGTLGQSGSSASCDLSNMKLPSSALNAPGSGEKVFVVALGIGSQNYTCADTTSTPVADGAVAQLFNVTCAVAGSPGIQTAALFPDSASIGSHFFHDSKTPEFSIPAVGVTMLKKVQDTDAPSPDNDVKWLRLQTEADGTTTQIKEVYRVETSGGVAPKTCEGQTPGKVFTVDYKAQYWMFV